MGGEVEDGGAAEIAHVQVAIRHDQLVVPGGGLGHDLALRVADDGMAEELVPVLHPALGHADAEAGILVAAGLDREMAVQHAQVVRLEAAPVLVDAGGVVAEHDQLDLLQPEHAPGLGPAAVVADQHADIHILAADWGADHGEAEVADLEVPLLQVLHLPDRVVVLVPGQVDLAVLQDDLA